MKRIIGWLLVVVYSCNLLFNLFFTFGESLLSHLPWIIISVILILVGIKLIKGRNVKWSKQDEPQSEFSQVKQ